ncbi:MAG: carbohydrate-binding protein [Phycisphaerae bacterium]|nr:carbohydrate-binding protein [Phycisphaerae bacterium]
MSTRCFTRAWCGLPLILAAVASASAENIHFTYFWHMEQPIYWPIRQSSGADRYERAWQSIQATDGGRANPQDNLRQIFQSADRVAAYQFRARDSVDLIRSRPEAGVQVSFSGGLIENLQSLGAVNQLGYSAGWHNFYREARGWRTADNLHTRFDIVLFPFHHALLPLCDDNTVRMQVRLYKEIYADAWGTGTPQSRGFFPSEMAFSQRLIPILDQEGVDWVIVNNEHISRGCTNFPLVLGSGGVNCEPPNRADQLNPPQSNWYRLSISRGCGPVNAAPFAYTPHYMRYVNPDTGQEHRVIAVPADQSLGWLDGYNPLSMTHFNDLSAWNNPARPMLVLMGHDGDNAWGGGFSYYMEAMPQFVNNASNAGYVAATVESYLAAHPVPLNDVVHVEDGAWVNADGDFGSPMFLNWNWPLLNASGQPDPANGWHVDARNWAVIVAAQNRVDTATQIAVGGLDGLNLRRIVYPDATTTLAERAWHYFCGALNSGFMYYGVSLDHEVKQTIACNQAVGYADQVIGSGSADATPPTVWIPQRWPYNPGSANFGPAYSYQQIINNGDFWIWTFAYDVSGLSNVTLKYRIDSDDVIDDANRTYAGGPGVGAWQNVAMAGRPFPAGNIYNDGSINFFVLPTYIANHYSAQLTGLRDVYLDYYVEATDTRGFVRRSAIQQVYVGDGAGSGGGPTERVVFTPNPGQAGQPLAIEYNPVNGPLGGATQVFAHTGYNQWQVVLPDAPMTWNTTTQRWTLTVNLPAEIQQFDLVFNNGAGTWDNNNGMDWHLPVTGGQQQWAMDGVVEPTAELVAQNGNYRLYAEVRADRLYVAANDAGEGQDHFIFIASPPGPTRNAPWGKTGLVANWAAFVADENNNDFEGWFDLAAGGFAQAATGANGGVIEGVIDLDAEFGGAMPSSVWLAFAAYQSQDGGTLVAANQVPPSVNGNFHVEASEYVEFDLTPALLGDMNCDGVVTVGDIGGFVLSLTDPAGYAAQYPACDINNADVNNDGFVTVSDIGPFVALLTGG